jgi:predicted transglutaminase-like cysteine proteinase
MKPPWKKVYNSHIMISKSAAIIISGILFLMLMFTAGCSSQEPTVEKVELSAGVSENGQPVNIGSTFPMTQEVLYSFVTVGQIHKPTKVGARWLLDKGEMPAENIEVGYFEQTVNTSGTISFGLKQDNGILFPVGEYRVQISLDGQISKSASFSITLPQTPTVQKMMDSASSNTTGFIHTTYSWVMNGTGLTLNMDIPKNLYDAYKSKTRIQTVNPDVYSLYISHPEDDEYISYIAEAIRQMALKQGLTTDQYIQSIIKFVRSVTYITDIRSEGYDEYPRYPIETLVDHQGDCEDSAILLASIMQASGLSPVLLITKPSVTPGHAAVGVAGEGSSDLMYYRYEGKNYTYVEATNSPLRIGELPDLYKPDDFVVVPLKPLPVITYDDIYYLRFGRVYRIKTYVKNIGSTTVDNIRIYASVESADNVTVSQVSKPFSLAVDEQALVTFYLQYRATGTLDLRVHGSVLDDITGYTIETQLEGP